MGIGTMTRTAPEAAAPAVDFDTRLMITSIGMDVLLAHVGGKALADAHAAVTAAKAEAERYGAEAVTLAAWKATQRPGLFQSHHILKAAGDLIRARGWHQGSWTDGKGAVCALAAIRLASGGNGSAEADAVSVLLGRIRDDLGQAAAGHSIPGWNDSRRSVGEVLHLLF